MRLRSLAVSSALALPLALSALAATASASLAPALTPVGDDDPWLGQDPVTDALAELGPDFRAYNDHVVFLASPFLEGRLPGTRGMDIARDYVEHYLRQAGLDEAFEVDGVPGFRQPFALSGTSTLAGQGFSAPGGTDLIAGTDYTALSLGAGGTVTAPAVFVGYSIASGPGDSEYSSYAEDDDLSGRVAVMLRFEPMDGEGNSRWAEESRPWSARAGFARKVRDAARRGAAGIVIINPPGCADPRASQLSGFSMGGSAAEVPVIMLSTEAGEGVVKAMDPEGRSLMDLRKLADEGRSVVKLNGNMTLEAEVVREELMAQNVAGLLKGHGALANELIVVGAHMDHLGMGNFGSRDRESAGRELHPGADDNASGTAAVIMLAERMVREYAELPEGTPARSILFMAFDAEESGLNGAFHYVANPILPIEDHVLMLNFDMIGRITNKRLSVSGGGTGVGMAEWVQPFFDASPLEIVTSRRGGGGSDHMAFERNSVPVLFGIIADFHDDYHTPRDTVDKINRVDALLTIDLWQQIVSAMSTRDQRFEFTEAQAEPAEASAPQASRGDAKVRFGIMPGSYDEDAIGVLVGSVTPGGSADEGGIEDGDLMVRWNGVKIENVMGWMGMLASHEPGDVVRVGVKRGGDELTLDITLQAK
ncbi:M28 family peptidase [Engelhardtia mirabilis]|uniref:Aminopeptidase YwaD n=1 Tax=Engelhardtia mirabilis TaxID=2528011 RepID=A0A518BKT6_9BACT|nr:Aminopeptidase YwaD precursor [Planctomycetes bacterium Pla133]QDV01913.1 Aminopeptidase YwaD precursor [Planctomycetes bacterium Pla86]